MEMHPILDIFLRWAIPFICAAIATSCLAYFRGFRKKQKDEEAKKDAEYELIKKGLQALLRSDIINTNEKYINKGYCPVYARETLEKTYSAYSGLEGDDVATGLYNEVMGLPSHAPTPKPDSKK